MSRDVLKRSCSSCSITLVSCAGLNIEHGSWPCAACHISCQAVRQSNASRLATSKATMMVVDHASQGRRKVHPEAQPVVLVDPLKQLDVAPSTPVATSHSYGLERFEKLRCARMILLQKH